MKTMIENEAQISVIGAIFAIGFVILTLPVGMVFAWLSRKLAVAMSGESTILYDAPGATGSDAQPRAVG